ncbi:MAG: hypothetical protein Q8935_01910 [Bacillota bacterium]|nr:hypothetical protein [Bacillota bacterium]
MNPVVDLDISKGESQVQAFLEKGKSFRKSFKVPGICMPGVLLLSFIVYQ